ncbi:MAG: zinc ABC transporter substrate-binding protein [Victivallales bacterium]|nr:zinc ABC transporter substrate-binding protein [Victivallales bacterium]
MKHRFFFFLTALAACLFSMPLCAADANIKIVATIFPTCDWVRQIIGPDAHGVEVVQLLDNGVDLHNFQPTVKEITRVTNCNLFLYVGGESDEWAEKLLRTPRKGRISVNLLQELGSAAKSEQHVEGMQGHDHAEEEHEHKHEKHAHEHEEEELDEHVWLSLRNAQALCKVICKHISELDPGNAAKYRTNTENYCKRLEELDARYRQAVSAARVKTLVFGDRFPFRYLVDDYGLSYFAAFSGCSAETEASFKTIAFLAGKVDELHLPCVLAIEGSRHKIAETVVRTTKTRKLPILTLDSLQSATSRDARAGKTYLNAMEKNLDVLRTALGN